MGFSKHEYWSGVPLPSVTQSSPTVSDPHGLQHARLPCPSPPPIVCSNSCPLSRWCHPTISSCLPLILLPSICPSIRVFSNKLALRIRWPKYWSFSFSISPSNDYSGLISFRMDWFSFQSQRRAMPKNVQTTVQLHSFHMVARLCSKSFKLASAIREPRTSRYTSWVYKLDFEQAEEPEIKLPTFTGS